MKKLVFSLLCMVLCLGCFGQADSVITVQHKKDSTHFIKYAGIALAVGSFSSPTGVIGIYWPFLLSSKYIDFSSGIGWSGVARINLGIGFHPEIRKRFYPFIAIEPAYSFKTGDITFDKAFTKAKPDERHYKASEAQLISYGVGVMWQPKNWQDPDLIFSTYIKLGYRELLSDYSISPKDPGNTDQSEINSIYYDLFESRFYWSIGIKINERITHRRKAN